MFNDENFATYVTMNGKQYVYEQSNINSIILLKVKINTLLMGIYIKNIIIS